jgi:hypothetical protein
MRARANRRLLSHTRLTGRPMNGVGETGRTDNHSKAAFMADDRSFDFTFDCPVYLLSPPDGGYLLTSDRHLCFWTDDDAVSSFLDRARSGRPYMDGLLLVEIATDDELLALLEEANGSGIHETVVDVADPDQQIVRAISVVEVMSLIRERIADLGHSSD